METPGKDSTPHTTVLSDDNIKQVEFPWDYFVTAFAFSWFFWGIAFLLGLNNEPVTASTDAQNLLAAASPLMLLLMLIGVFGPFFSTFILTYRQQGRAGIAALWRSGWKINIGWSWLCIIFLLFPVIKIVSLLIAGVGISFGAFSQPLTLLGMALFMYFLGGPFGEEFGWRGYALPRLLQKHKPVNASLMLGLFWVAWHLPLFIIAGSPQAQLPLLPWAISVLSVTIIMTWVYLNTGGVVFAAIALHFSSNWSNSLFLPADGIMSGWGRPENIGVIIQALIALLLIVFFIMTRKKSTQNSI
tara:strand:+ start:21032 stop:21934 length:903 start_codon:yes stop_codon:yes gene_type:complete